MLEHEECLRSLTRERAAILGYLRVLVRDPHLAEDLFQETCVVVLVRQKIPLAGLTSDALVPREVGGVKTDIIEVGDIRAFKATPIAGDPRRAALASAITRSQPGLWAVWCGTGKAEKG